MTASALIKDEFWCSGPQFLQLSPDKWPIVLKVKLTEEVYRCYDLNVQKNVETSFSKGSCLASVSSPSPCCLHTGKQKSTLLHPTCQLIIHFSSFYWLKLAVCWLNRFKTYLLTKVRSKGLTQPPIGPIMVNKLSKAENSVIGYVQQTCFSVNLALVSEGRRLPGTSLLHRLNPTVIDGLLWVGGRLDSAPLPYDLKHPIILLESHFLTEI